MQLSFAYTYLNLFLTGIGISFVVSFWFPKSSVHFEFDKYLIEIALAVLLAVVVPYITIGIFHLVETKNSFCLKCCLPFTRREEFQGFQLSKEVHEKSVDVEMHEIM